MIFFWIRIETIAFIQCYEWWNISSFSETKSKQWTTIGRTHNSRENVKEKHIQLIKIDMDNKLIKIGFLLGNFQFARWFTLTNSVSFNVINKCSPWTPNKIIVNYLAVSIWQMMCSVRFNQLEWPLLCQKLQIVFHATPFFGGGRSEICINEGTLWFLSMRIIIFRNVVYDSLTKLLNDDRHIHIYGWMQCMTSPLINNRTDCLDIRFPWPSIFIHGLQSETESRTLFHQSFILLIVTWNSCINQCMQTTAMFKQRSFVHHVSIRWITFTELSAFMHVLRINRKIHRSLSLRKHYFFGLFLSSFFFRFQLHHRNWNCIGFA